MKKLNSYIVEKLKLDKNIKERDIEEKIIDLLKEYENDLYLDDVFKYTIYNKDNDEVDNIWVVNDTIRYSLAEDASGSTVLDDLSELFTMEEIQKIQLYYQWQIS